MLEEVADVALRSAAARVLDLGIGTGNLSEALLRRDPDLEIWGVDFSGEMLERAGRKLPAAHLIQADIRRLPDLELPRFDAAVSSYVLHELPDEEKAKLIGHLIGHRLEPGGVLVIGDIAFETQGQLDKVRELSEPHWDDTEHYFVADRFLRYMRDRGITGEYLQVSLCAGVFAFRAGADG